MFSRWSISQNQSIRVGLSQEFRMKPILVVFLGACVLLSVSVTTDASIIRTFEGIGSSIPRPSHPLPPYVRPFDTANNEPVAPLMPSHNFLLPKPVQPILSPELQHPQPHYPSYYQPAPIFRPSAPKP